MRSSISDGLDLLAGAQLSISRIALGIDHLELRGDGEGRHTIFPSIRYSAYDSISMEQVVPGWPSSRPPLGGMAGLGPPIPPCARDGAPTRWRGRRWRPTGRVARVTVTYERMVRPAKVVATSRCRAPTTGGIVPRRSTRRGPSPPVARSRGRPPPSPGGIRARRPNPKGSARGSPPPPPEQSTQKQHHPSRGTVGSAPSEALAQGDRDQQGRGQEDEADGDGPAADGGVPVLTHGRHLTTTLRRC